MIEYAKLIQFIGEYTEFFESMVEAENTKLNILLSNDLKLIEENILTQQVNQKRMENMENRRINVFEEHRLSQSSFKELIDLLDDKSILHDYHIRLEQAIQQIKYLNKKSMELIRFNLKMVETRNNKEYGYDLKGGR